VSKIHRYEVSSSSIIVKGQIWVMERAVLLIIPEAYFRMR